jgi:ssDNA-binding Zn-finger/Zn-ribbon topoisomerase 1
MTALWHGSGCYVPREVAECPECSGELYARSHSWIEETGQPIAEAIDIGCVNDPDCNHRYWQSDWQSIVDAIRKWCKATNSGEAKP